MWTILTYVARIRNLQTVDKCAHNPQQPMFFILLLNCQKDLRRYTYSYHTFNKLLFSLSIVDYSLCTSFFEYLSPLCTCQGQWVYALLNAFNVILPYMYALEQCAKIPPFEKNSQGHGLVGIPKIYKAFTFVAFLLIGTFHFFPR